MSNTQEDEIMNELIKEIESSLSELTEDELALVMEKCREILENGK